MRILGLITSILIVLLYTHSAFAERYLIRLTNGEWPPYLSKHLPEYGFASHVVTRAFDKVGLDVEYEFYPWQRSYEYAKSGSDLHGRKWHGTLVWTKTENRQEVFYYSDPVIEAEDVLFYRKDNPIDWQDKKDLKGRVFAITQHTAYPMLEDMERKGLITLERAGNYDTLLKRVYFRKIDATPLVKYVGLYYLTTSFPEIQQQRITYSDSRARS